MSNRNTHPAEPATVLDELAFAKGGSFEIIGSVMRSEECYSDCVECAWDIVGLMNVLDYGLLIGKDLSNEAKHLAETCPSEDELVRGYFRAVCVGEDVRRTFRLPGDDSQEDTSFPYDSGWDWLYGNKRKERINVTEEVATKASSMAQDAFKLMSKLSPSADAESGYVLTLVARLAIRTPEGALMPTNIYVKATYDYVAQGPGGGVFVGAYEVAPCFSVAEVRRHAGVNHWGARAYLGKLLASAYFGSPIEWRYVVASAKPYSFTYVNAAADSVDDLRHHFDFGSQEGPYPCRAYDVGGPSLDEGRFALHRALYRLSHQKTHDAWYLRHETI